jgi:hypothetical protein
MSLGLCDPIVPPFYPEPETPKLFFPTDSGRVSPPVPPAHLQSRTDLPHALRRQLRLTAIHFLLVEPLSSQSDISVCHRCEHRQKQCNGPCACTIDGKDIIEHAASIGCPKGYFENPPPQPAPVPLKPVPREEWKAGALALADMAEPGDRGIGDVIERNLAVGGIVFKALVKSLGFECGCSARRDELNQLYPLI